MATLTNAVDSVNAKTAIGGAVPGANDTVYLNQFASDYTNAAGAALDTNAITLFQALPGWSGNGGWDSLTNSFQTYMKIKTSATGWFKYNASGRWFYLASTSAATVIQNIEHDPALNCQLVLDACDNESTHILGGAFTATANADINKLYGAGGMSHLLASGPTMGECWATGVGTVNLYRAATLLGTAGDGKLYALLTTATPTTMNVNGGTLYYAGSAVTTGNFYSGILDLTLASGVVAFTTGNFFGNCKIRVKPSMRPTFGTTNGVGPRYIDA